MAYPRLIARELEMVAQARGGVMHEPSNQIRPKGCLLAWLQNDRIFPNELAIRTFFPILIPAPASDLP
jgi:hypothetical protein